MRQHHKLTAVLASGLVAAGLVLGAPSVTADQGASSRLVLRDGAGDVWKFYPRQERQVRLADFPRADVLRAVVRHDEEALRVRMRFGDLRRVGTHLFWLHIRTSDYQYDAVVTSEPGARRGRRYFQGDDGSRRCAGFLREIRYADDVVTLRIPRSCVQEPRWVKVGIFNQLSLEDPGPLYFDTPLSRRSPVTAAEESRRLYVG